jgi:hypothetical protein
MGAPVIRISFCPLIFFSRRKYGHKKDIEIIKSRQILSLSDHYLCTGASQRQRNDLISTMSKRKAEEDALGAIDIKKIMSAEGPLVTCVILRAGPAKTAEELVLDFSPKKSIAEVTLGGAVEFMGQWEDIGVVIVQRKDQDNADLPLNEHKVRSRTNRGMEGRRRGRGIPQLCLPVSFTSRCPSCQLTPFIPVATTLQHGDDPRRLAIDANERRGRTGDL